MKPSQQGQALIEFILLLPIAVLLVFGALGLLTALSARNALQQALLSASQAQAAHQPVTTALIRAALNTGIGVSAHIPITIQTHSCPTSRANPAVCVALLSHTTAGSSPSGSPPPPPNPFSSSSSSSATQSASTTSTITITEYDYTLIGPAGHWWPPITWTLGPVPVDSVSSSSPSSSPAPSSSSHHGRPSSSAHPI